MSVPPDIADLVPQWLQKADNDLRTARHTLLIPDDCPCDTVCFHAQQCVEKCLRAILVCSQTPFSKTHDLEELSLLLPSSFRIPLSVESGSSVFRGSRKGWKCPRLEPLGASEAAIRGGALQEQRVRCMMDPIGESKMQILANGSRRIVCTVQAAATSWPRMSGSAATAVRLLRPRQATRALA